MQRFARGVAGGLQKQFSVGRLAAPVAYAKCVEKVAPSLLMERPQRWASRRASSATAQPRSSQMIDVNGQQIFVVTSGNLGSGIPVLCMPGAMGTAETDFAYQLDGLSSDHGVVSLDPRGYGKSRPPARRYPVNFYQLDADDAADVMKALGVERYHVIGWSDGAISATLLAAKNPQCVEKLVVFGIQAYITKEDVDVYESMRDVEQAWSKRMLATHRAVYGDDVQPMWSSFCDAMKNIYEAGGDFCQKEAKTLTCPTLILHGDKDPIVPGHHPLWMKDNIKSASMHSFPEGKHNIHQKFSNDFNKIVLKFFAE